jgi:hypothetical protein
MWRGGVGGNRYAQPTGSRVHPAPWLANRNAPRTPLTVSSATDPGACCHKPPPPHRCADPPAHLPIREVGQTSTGRSSLLIRRWRTQDSNRRSPSRGCRLILGEEKGPAVDQIVSKDAVLFTGDQWFESVFLQRRVSNELSRPGLYRSNCYPIAPVM